MSIMPRTLERPGHRALLLAAAGKKWRDHKLNKTMHCRIHCMLLILAAIIQVPSRTEGMDNSTVRWADTPFGSVAFEDGDCPTGRALQLHGEVMPDLTDLILRILRKGDTVAEIGKIDFVRHKGWLRSQVIFKLKF